jgi:hypothetical protein
LDAKAFFEMSVWILKGRPVPPPAGYKQWVVRSYARRAGIRVLVETGTYLGEMIEASLPHFDRIFSIEIDPKLHQEARRKFAGHPKVELLLGDSAQVLPQLLKEPALDGPTLFWLDGHFSGGVTGKGSTDTPIMAELKALLLAKRENDVILVDDLRLFGTHPEYPSVDQVVKLAKSHRPNSKVVSWHDVLRILNP